jgi:hypothetical protein
MCDERGGPDVSGSSTGWFRRPHATSGGDSLDCPLCGGGFSASELPGRINGHLDTIPGPDRPGYAICPGCTAAGRGCAAHAAAAHESPHGCAPALRALVERL